jgi:uncharacterized protein (DUF58 family)
MLTSSGKWTVSAALGLFALGWLLAYPFFLALGVSFLIAVVVGLFFVLWRPTLSARQAVSPPVVGVGELASSIVTIDNTGPRKSSPVVASNQVAGSGVALALPAIAAGASHTASVTLPTSRRGRYDVGPLNIERVDPLGLFRATTHRGSVATLVVHPEIHAMTPLPTGHRRELEGSAAEQPHEGGISFHSLRDYELGDDLRLIHWRSVAKTGALMVRKNIITSEPRLMIVLDTWEGSYDDADRGDGSFEDAVRVAASMVQAGCNSRYPVMFRATSGLAVDAKASGEGRTDIMRLLARIAPSADDAGLNGVVRFAELGEGVSLGAVTGQPPADRTVGISRARGRFDMIAVVQVGENHDRPPMNIPGALVLNGSTSLDVAERWKARFG